MDAFFYLLQSLKRLTTYGLNTLPVMLVYPELLYLSEAIISTVTVPFISKPYDESSKLTLN
jgi:hypothetical protein